MAKTKLSGIKNIIVYVFVFTLVAALMSVGVESEPIADKQALLAYISQVKMRPRFEWNPNNSVCTWFGVTCDVTNSSVIILRLPAVSIISKIPPNTIGNLTKLRILSLKNNKIPGEIPPDFANLVSLHHLFLQLNEFSGVFPEILTKLPRLMVLDLSRNKFSGRIPATVNALTMLRRLHLWNNSFSGELPSIDLPVLVVFNVTNNSLNGSIPARLAVFPPDSFAGNLALCGKPLDQPCRGQSGSLSTTSIIAISAGCGAIAFLLLLVILFSLLRMGFKRRVRKASASGAVEGGVTSSSKDEINGGSMDAERHELVFFEDGVYTFDMEELLRASAEVLAKGSIGRSYKAVLEDGTALVVKRVKNVVVSKKDLESQLRVLGKVKHPNVVPLQAFCFSKNEKLLVSDFMAGGSLSDLLHGRSGSEKTPLDWEHRMTIAIEVGRGVSHLHSSWNMVHGNIKASNILFYSNQAGVAVAAVSDFGLNSFFGPSTPRTNLVSGYRAPEVVETRQVTFKSDVYSFGVLLLELLTGKCPNQALGENGIDLPRWAQSVVREEWTTKVFDAEMMLRYSNIDEELIQVFQIALSCVSTAPNQRPIISKVVKMMEEISTSTFKGFAPRLEITTVTS